MSRRARVTGLVGVGVRQLVGDPARLAFAVTGVAAAVLAITLLFGVGAGVVETGADLTEQSEFDLWMTGGPVELSPTSIGGFRNPVTDAHEMAAAIESQQGVDVAVPMAFQAIYVSTDGQDFETVMGTGVGGSGPLIELQAGTGFTAADTHYADGEYDGELTSEAIIDPGTAAKYNLSVGDTLHVGGTISLARETTFQVIGISPTFRRFHGTNTVALLLSELQTLTGSAANDRATLISVRLADDADQSAVKQRLTTTFPEFDVRTNQEQITAILERQALVIAGGLGLVAFAVLAGMALSLNLFLSLIYQQRLEMATYRAIGGSRESVLVLALVQALTIATVGCLLGLVITPPLAWALDRAATAVTGFEGLVQVPPFAYAIGAGIALVFGVVGTVLATWQVTRHSSVTALTN
ncbi:putative ABC transport system permease protein [Halovenus aranensis]|uniref:Putative ABC transport system permease protein n=1 Tax=Halovenus aranensis TaxID=890420 RepID=A0A1G8XUV1_9EURY|nr:ABC transporter permease [Halovenus aranensis]SDJ94422.1 putative ABC transport system permease protein [Halovenus aranensis]